MATANDRSNMKEPWMAHTPGVGCKDTSKLFKINAFFPEATSRKPSWMFLTLETCREFRFEKLPKSGRVVLDGKRLVFDAVLHNSELEDLLERRVQRTHVVTTSPRQATSARRSTVSRIRSAWMCWSRGRWKSGQSTCGHTVYDKTKITSNIRFSVYLFIFKLKIKPN